MVTLPFDMALQGVCFGTKGVSLICHDSPRIFFLEMVALVFCPAYHGTVISSWSFCLYGHVRGLQKQECLDLRSFVGKVVFSPYIYSIWRNISENPDHVCFFSCVVRFSAVWSGFPDICLQIRHMTYHSDIQHAFFSKMFIFSALWLSCRDI